jgi:two-component system, OmpR family, response regulator CpxR
MSISASRTSACSARVLLINHNHSGLAARKAVLEELGCRVSTASSGEHAWEQLSGSGFELVITEYKMGKMNGAELIQKIRGLEPGVPVILLSGYVEAFGLTESSTGADVVLAKGPNEVTHMIRAVSRLLKQGVRKPVRSQRKAAAAARKSS